MCCAVLGWVCRWGSAEGKVRLKKPEEGTQEKVGGLLPNQTGRRK